MEVAHECIKHNSRAVNEDVDRSEFFFGSCYQRLDLPTVRDVGRYDQAPHLATLSVQPGLHLKKGVSTTRRERQMCAFVRERTGHRRADAAGGSGHHCDPALQSSKVYVGLLSSSRAPPPSRALRSRSSLSKVGDAPDLIRCSLFPRALILDQSRNRSTVSSPPCGSAR
jgi:hypothetical protein